MSRIGCMRVVLKNLREWGITEISYSSLLGCINEDHAVCHIGAGAKRDRSPRKQKNWQKWWFGCVVFCHCNSHTKWYCLVYAIFLFQHQDYSFWTAWYTMWTKTFFSFGCFTHYSLSRSIAAVNIESDQSLSHSYDVRWKVAAKWSMFSSQRKMMLSGWLDVSGITIAPGILCASHAEKR